MIWLTKKIWLGVTCIPVFIFVYLCFYQKSALPKLDCPEEINLGAYENGSLAEVVFEIRNSGNAPLTASDFRTDCACNALEICTVEGFEPLRQCHLKPGESARIKLRKTVRGEAGQPIKTAVVFRTNDPNKPEGLIRINIANVLAGLSAFPSQLVLGKIPQGGKAIQQVTLNDSTNQNRKIEKIEISDPKRIQATLISNEKMLVEIDTSYPGSIDGFIRLHVIGGKSIPDPIPVTGKVIGPIECTPSVLRFPRNSSKGPIYSASCIICSTNGNPLELTFLDITDGIKIETESRTNNSCHYLKITVDRKISSGRRIIPVFGKTTDWSGPFEIILEKTDAEIGNGK